MDTIWKYEFVPQRRVKILMPAGATLLSCGVQNPGKICVWAKVDQANVPFPPTPTILNVFGTGDNLGAYYGGQFVGTVLDGKLVWHVFLEE